MHTYSINSCNNSLGKFVYNIKEAQECVTEINVTDSVLKPTLKLCKLIEIFLLSGVHPI